MFSKLSISRKIYTGFSVLIIAFVLFGLFVRGQVIDIVNKQTNFYEQNYKLVQKIGNLELLFKGAALEMREIQVGTHFKNQKQIDNAKSKMDQYQSELTSILLSLEQTSLLSGTQLQELKQAAQFYLDAHTRYAAVILDEQSTREDFWQAYTEGLVPAHKNLWPIFKPIHKSASEGAIAVNSDISSAAENTISVLWVVLFFCIITATLIALFIGKRITSPIVQVVEALQKLESGNITTELFVSQQDETGKMASSLNSTTKRLKNVVTSIYQASEQILGNSVALRSITDNVEKSTKRQLEETEQVATSIEQISANVDLTAQHADTVANSSQEMTGRAQESLCFVEETVLKTQSLVDNVTESSLKVNELKQQSNQIVQILDVIKGIAEQTNLLALNAAIEAARAGEQGRGFAVVADEVRSLAQRTQQSTTEIEDMLDGLNRGTDAVVNSMESSLELATETAGMAKQSGSSIEDITNSIVDVNEMILQIATSNKEQSLSAQEVSKSVQRINELAKDTESVSSEAANASAQLREEGQAMQQQVAFF